MKFTEKESRWFSCMEAGGSDAMQIAIRHPEIVNKLIVASSFYKRDGLLPGFFDGMKEASLENMPAVLKTEYLKEIPDMDRFKIMFQRDKDRMLSFKDWSDDDIKSITAPTLLIAGDSDVVITEHAVAMSHLILNCKLAIIPREH